MMDEDDEERRGAYKLSQTSSSVLGIMGKGGEKHAVRVSHAVNI